MGRMARHVRLSGIDHLEEFAAGAEWYADHVAAANMRARVPTCPGWTVLDLTRHLGNTHSWAASVVETGEAAAELDDSPGSRRPAKVALWYLAKAEDLYAVLRTVDPERPCWNFAFGEGTASFWERRQTHETIVHGLDLAGALGADRRVPEHVAADGIDEVLTVFLLLMHVRGHRARREAPLTIHAVDVDVAWTLHPAPMPPAGAGVPMQDGEPLVVPGARDGVDLLEGPADVLFRVLWKRAPVDHPGLRVQGSEERVRRFLGSRLVP